MNIKYCFVIFKNRTGVSKYMRFSHNFFSDNVYDNATICSEDDYAELYVNIFSRFKNIHILY